MEFYMANIKKEVRIVKETMSVMYREGKIRFR